MPPLPTQAQIDQYLSNKGLQCPHCQSESMEGEDIIESHSPPELAQRVRCLNPKCGATWTDVYTLTGVRTC
jgi:hypothetical protein